MTRISASDLRDVRAEAARLASAHVETGASVTDAAAYCAQWAAFYEALILEGPTVATDRHAKRAERLAVAWRGV